MAWSNSKVFPVFIQDALNRTAAFDLNLDVPKVSLHNNSITPDQTVAAATSAYNTGVWTTTNEVSHSGQWAAGGVVLASFTSTYTSATYTYDAADTASGAAATLAAVFGCLVYDDSLTTPVADQGICFNYFGGTNSVTGGTLTVVWSGSGIFAIAA